MGGAVCVCVRVHDKSTHARTFTTTARKKKKKNTEAYAWQKQTFYSHNQRKGSLLCLLRPAGFRENKHPFIKKKKEHGEGGLLTLRQAERDRKK